MTVTAIGENRLHQSTTMHFMPSELTRDLCLEKRLDDFIKWHQQHPNLMAHIPWIPKTPMKSLSLYQGNVYETIFKITKKDECVLDKSKLALYLLLGSAFPSFLPERYHAMNSKALLKMSPKIQYWQNASIFLLQSQFFGQSFHNLVFKRLATQTPDLVGLLHPRVHAMRQTFSPEQCQSAEEFLLEPWVLLQLPFQPSLLHQWAIALLAETLKFQKETMTIFVIGVPCDLWHEMKLLKKMLEKLMDSSIGLLSIFSNFSKRGQENICKRVRRVRNKLLRILTEVTPIVEFILSVKCRNLISGIKRASWGSIHHQKQQILHSLETNVDFGSYHIWYNAFFWTAEGQTPKKLSSERKYHSDQHKDLLKKLRFNMLMLNFDKSVASLLKFVDDKIVSKGLLVGASRKEILAVAAKAPQLLQFPCLDYFTYLQDLSTSSALDASICGVTYNIMKLYSELRLEEDTALTARTLIQLLSSKRFGSKKVLYIDSQCQQGYKFSASTNLKYTLNKVLANREWTYKKVLQRTKDSFTAPIVEKPAPTLKFEKIAAIFQARIKNLVFNMLKRQFETSSGPQPMLWYPECATVQYLLPCFVATFLELHKDPSASWAQVKNFMLLVHELLLSYEQNAYEQSFTKEWKQPYLYERRNTLTKDIVTSRTAFLQCINDKFCRQPTVVQCFTNLMLLDMARGAGVKDVLCDWTVQMFMLTTRLLKCVQTLGWYTEPLTKTLDQVWSGCSFTSNIGLSMLYDICSSKWNENQEDPKTRLFVTQHQLYLQKTLMPPGREKNAELTRHQVLAIAIYIALQKSRNLGAIDVNLQGPSFSLDFQSEVFWAAQTQDHWKLKQLLGPLLCVKTDSDDCLVPLSVVYENIYCWQLRESISADQPPGLRRWVKMTHPGEHTMFPVKHCRFCGLLTTKEFRLCSMCLECPEYTDKNYFCSAECEEALIQRHREDHARFFLMKLNMDSC